jgi:PAS domain S-box-containing protein
MNRALKKTFLRKQAEEKLSAKTDPDDIPPGDMKKLIHELQVHQVELEMQNEELRKAQAEIERSRTQYADLYDFAPVGYFTFDQKGFVKELNLTAAKLLGGEREIILGKPFRIFIAPEYADVFLRHRKSILRNGQKQRCELKLVRMNQTSFYAAMESVAARDGTEHSDRIRSAVVDIDEMKKHEQAVLESEDRLRHLSLLLIHAQEDERKRIAGEIHDALGSALAGIKMMAEKALEQLEKGPDASADTLNRLILLIGESCNECRRIQTDLRPPILDDLGLAAALSWHLRNFEETYPHIRIERKIAVEEADVPATLKSTIYRLAQEALNNVAKHAEATLVFFSLKGSSKGIDLAIADNGLGFDVDEILGEREGRPGLGLKSMRERVGLTGGAFEIRSARGKGTTILASWPAR